MNTLMVKICHLTDIFNWYMLGDTYTVIYDPYVEKYLAVADGGAGRYILPEDCEVIE